jgi:hypothetical protein
MDGARDFLRQEAIRDGFIPGRNSPSLVKLLRLTRLLSTTESRRNSCQIDFCFPEFILTEMAVEVDDFGVDAHVCILVCCRSESFCPEGGDLELMGAAESSTQLASRAAPRRDHE